MESMIIADMIKMISIMGGVMLFMIGIIILIGVLVIVKALQDAWNGGDFHDDI